MNQSAHEKSAEERPSARSFYEAELFEKQELQLFTDVVAIAERQEKRLSQAATLKATEE